MLANVMGLITGCLLIGVSGILVLLLTIALREELPVPVSGASVRAPVTGLLTILLLAQGSYSLHLGRTAVVLLLLLAVLIMAWLGRFATSLAATAAAADHRG